MVIRMCILFIFLPAISIAQKVINLDIYITPKNVNYGWYDNGIFQFPLKKHSIMVPYDRRSYNCNTKNDSLYELFFISSKTKIDIYKLIPKNDTPDKKRIAIINHMKKDTMFIDVNNNLIFKNKCYVLNDKLKNYIETLMPIEIKENWIFDLMSR